jgi:hypothetical protein
MSAVCENSDSSTDWIKDVSNETATLNREQQKEILDRGSESYFYHWLLLSICYFIWAQFNIRCEEAERPFVRFAVYRQISDYEFNLQFVKPKKVWIPQKTNLRRKNGGGGNLQTA